MQVMTHLRPYHGDLLYGAYGWLLLSGFLHFAVDVVSQALRGKRVPSHETTLYYGLNTTYALSQVLFAALALFALRQGTVALGQPSGIGLGLLAAAAWLVIGFRFFEYTQPRWALLPFAALLISAGLTS